MGMAPSYFDIFAELGLRFEGNTFGSFYIDPVNT